MRYFIVFFELYLDGFIKVKGDCIAITDGAYLNKDFVSTSIIRNEGYPV